MKDCITRYINVYVENGTKITSAFKNKNNALKYAKLTKLKKLVTAYKVVLPIDDM